MNHIIHKFVSVFIIVLIFVTTYSISPFSAHAENLTAGQTRTFVVSAYYSPLPNQDAYVFGSYESDKYVNGQGLRGADFTKVYLGMLAAPKSYPFGTKIYIPGVGTGTVHDRGGAITAGHASDRIDVWMGWGDDGRKRALNWGMRTVTGTIQPWNTPDNIEFSIGSYNSQIKKKAEVQIFTSESTPESLTLKYGDSNQQVTNLQKFLKSRELFDYTPTGYYGEKTENAVFQFQKKHGIVRMKTDAGAGIFGPKTRKQLEQLWDKPINETSVFQESIASEDTKIQNEKTVLQQKNSKKIEIYTPAIIHSPIFNLPIIPNEQEPPFVAGLGYGDENNEVLALQQKLQSLGFFNFSPTGYFGPKTKESIIEYQIQNKIIVSRADTGAGYFGPQTYASILSK